MENPIIKLFKKFKFNFLSKREQRLMINESKDAKIVRRLYELANAPKDSAEYTIYQNLDILQVVRSMDDPSILLDPELEEKNKNRLDEKHDEFEEKNALDEILKEAMEGASAVDIKEAFDNTSDMGIQKVINADVLEKNNKAILINSINSNVITLKNCADNIEIYSDFMLAKTLDGLTPEEEPEKQVEIENLKINIIALKSCYNIVKYGRAFHLDALISSLEEKSKLYVAKEVLEKLNKYEKNISDEGKNNWIKQQTYSVAKINLLLDLYNLTDLSDEEKDKLLNNVSDNLTEDEKQKLQEEIDKEKSNKLLIEQSKKEQQIEDRDLDE